MIGCLFHFKQVAHCKMKKLLFPDDEVGFAIRQGIYDLLTVIPVVNLNDGIDFVFDKINKCLQKIYADTMIPLAPCSIWNFQIHMPFPFHMYNLVVQGKWFSKKQSQPWGKHSFWSLSDFNSWFVITDSEHRSSFLLSTMALATCTPVSCCQWHHP